MRTRWAGVALATVGVITMAGCSSSDSASSLKAGGNEDRDLRVVQASVEDVQITIGLAIKKSTPSNINQLAQTAQQVHDSLSNMKDQWAADAPIDDKSTNVEIAINDLKNSMGALVAYTGNPNPSTLAHFTTQWQTGTSEWNQAVRALYSKTGRKAPTIPTS